MFNAPRSSPSQYTGPNGFVGVFVTENPLSASVYSDGGYSEVDPWAGTPSLPSPKQQPSALGNVLGILQTTSADLTVPSDHSYVKATLVCLPSTATRLMWSIGLGVAKFHLAFLSACSVVLGCQPQ